MGAVKGGSVLKRTFNEAVENPIERSFFVHCGPGILSGVDCRVGHVGTHGDVRMRNAKPAMPAMAGSTNSTILRAHEIGPTNFCTSMWLSSPSPWQGEG